MIIIQSRRRKIEKIREEYPDAYIIDVTSKGELPFVKFSPFYPLGRIPVPFSSGVVAESVEGIWQGLKVFENHGIDRDKFAVANMKGLKRTVRKFGKPLGHQKGVDNQELLDYITARKEIYVPVYNWVLENRLFAELNGLHKMAVEKGLILLDYETNENVEDPSKPLSHAGLIKRYMEEKWL